MRGRAAGRRCVNPAGRPPGVAASPSSGFPVLFAGFRRAAVCLFALSLLAGAAGLASPASADMSVSNRVTAPCDNGVIIPNPDDKRRLVADCEALWAARDILDPEGSVLTSWNADTTLGSWMGITVSGDPARVTAIWLAANGSRLNGSIPAELGKLTELVWLRLQQNAFTGELPSELCSLTKLRDLAVSYNRLSGKAPACLGNLSRLDQIHLNDNQFTGPIPPQYGNLNTEHFHLSNNRFTGEIPPELGNIDELGFFMLSGNRLTGEIPDELSRPPHLHSVILHNNRLSGELPDWFGDKELWRLELSNNRFTGPIPDLDGMPLLIELELGGNSLSGCVADSLRRQLHTPYSNTPPYGEVGAPFCADGKLNSPAAGAPTIAGTARVGETLTAGTSDISDADGLDSATFSYRWLADDADISGATGNTYTLAAADEGKAVKVRVSFSDDAENGETLTSEATAAVAPPAMAARLAGAATEAAGRGLILTFTKDIALSGLHRDYTVLADGARRATRSAFWDGRTVGLVLAEPVRWGETVTVAYAQPASGAKLHGADKRPIAGFGPVAVENTVARPKNRPATVRGPAALTAVLVGLPAEHDGERLFRFELRFSENFPGRFDYRVLRDRAFGVTNGRVREAQRVARGRNDRWTIAVRPALHEDVTIVLQAATDCALPGAVCTEAGRALANTATATVRGPAALTAADAEATEGADDAAGFRVSLSRAAHAPVTVDYATRDGTAVAGEDYTFTRGTLSFATGELEKTVPVPILDDALDEGSETFTLKLMNARGAAIADGEAVGTIENSDPLQKMWLSRFGRTVAVQTVEALEGRFAIGSQASPRMTMTVAGRNMDLSRLGDGQALTGTMTGLAQAFGAPGASNRGDPFARRDTGGPWNEAVASAPARRVAGRDLLPGSSFHFTTGGASGPGGAMTGWGKVLSGGSRRSFAGDLSFASETSTGVLGMDWERERLLVGVALSRSVETGRASFAPSGSRYDIEGSLSMVTPYLHMRANDRVSFWSAVGSGTGIFSLSQGGGWQRSDIAMRLAAAGGRAELLRPGVGGGPSLSLKTDAFFVRTESARVSSPGLGNLASATGDASRVRTVLEGSQAFALAGGASLEPSLELGLRHDGGDAETGTGVELGGGVIYADRSSRLSVEARARMLAAHAERGYEEWGVSGTVRLAPGARGRGLSFSLSPALGAASSGAERLWRVRDAGRLAPGGEFEAPRRLRGELGYGLSLFGGRFTGTPNLGIGVSDTARDWRLGWRLTSAVRGDPGFAVSLDATRRETANDNGAAEHGAMLTGSLHW